MFQLIVLARGIRPLGTGPHASCPARRHLSALGRGGYLIVQSIVPELPLDRVDLRPPTALPGLQPRHRGGDVARCSTSSWPASLAKLSTIAVLWTVAFVIMTRAKVTDGDGEEAEPLMWSDVEREIERADRRDRWAKWMPPSAEPTE